MTPIFLSEAISSHLLESKAESRPGVLRVLEGIFSVSDEKSKDDNRNSRLYSSNLLQKKIIEAAPTRELMERSCLFGELDHPDDRLDVKMEKVSHRISKLKFEDGYVKGEIEVLPTPMGQILEAFCAAGAKPAISSRAAGNTVQEQGKMRVVEDGYVFYTYDVVLNPGFKSAVLSQVREGVAADVAGIPVPGGVLPPPVSPEALNSQIESIIRSVSDPSQLRCVESLLNGIDENVFASSISALRERMSTPAPTVPESPTTLSLLEHSQRELFTVRGERNALTSKVTSLEEEKRRALESKSDVEDEKSFLVREVESLREEVASKSELSNRLQVSNIISNVRLESALSQTPSEKDFTRLGKFLSLATGITHIRSRSLREALRESESKLERYESIDFSALVPVSEFQALKEELENSIAHTPVHVPQRTRTFPAPRNFKEDVPALSSLLSSLLSEALGLPEEEILDFLNRSGSMEKAISGVQSFVADYLAENFSPEEEPVAPPLPSAQIPEAPAPAVAPQPPVVQEVKESPVRPTPAVPPLVESAPKEGFNLDDIFEDRTNLSKPNVQISERSDIRVPSEPILNDDFSANDHNRLRRILRNTGAQPVIRPR